MEWNEVTIQTTTEALDIVSGYLISYGIGGLVIEDSADFNEFLGDTQIHWDYVDQDLMKLKTAPTVIKIYLPDTIQGIETFAEIKRGLLTLRDKNPEIELGELTISCNTIKEEDWQTAWKSYYHVTKLTDRLVICPCWEEYTPSVNEVKIILDPGMAFGTGTHETTRLMLTYLDETIKQGDTLLDVGTGSGILAITGMLLLAKMAVGVDIDELAVRIANENAILNGVGDKIQFICGDLCENVDGKYDVICANIVADVIILLSKDIISYLKPNGHLLVSGIIEDRESEVRSILEQQLTFVSRKSENDWVAMDFVLSV